MEDIKLANKLNPRFGLNWVKLRAWEQSDLDAIIMVVGEGGCGGVLSLGSGSTAWGPSFECPNGEIAAIFGHRDCVRKLQCTFWTTVFTPVSAGLQDTDMVILQDLSHLFSLPTDFAIVPRQGHTDFYYNQGGFIFLRPCRPAFAAMEAQLSSDAHLHFTQASLWVGNPCLMAAMGQGTGPQRS